MRAEKIYCALNELNKTQEFTSQLNITSSFDLKKLNVVVAKSG